VEAEGVEKVAVTNDFDGAFLIDCGAILIVLEVKYKFIWLVLQHDNFFVKIQNSNQKECSVT